MSILDVLIEVLHRGRILPAAIAISAAGCVCVIEFGPKAGEVGLVQSRYAIGLGLLLGLSLGCGDRDQPPGEIEGGRRPQALVAASAAAQQAVDLALRSRAGAFGGVSSKRVLFGDLHVHSTYSIDAFVYALPLFAGEGAHPPADACDFARYCAAVDFFSLNDHAEGLTPERWQATKESLRQCNALAGDPKNPDLVAFVGWEWTQVGLTPETHYGHKNVIFPGLSEQELPVRPITSLSDDVMQRAPAPWVMRTLQLVGSFGFGAYADFLWLIERLSKLPNCEHGIDTRELPIDCRENARTPEELFEKLGQWGFDTLVIPHGLAWGVHAPMGARLDNQLTLAQHDPERQGLIEIFSGHGNSEEYRPWRAYGVAADGNPSCPEPTPDFLPCCWQAGEIMRARCGDLPEAECEARVVEAKRLALEAHTAPQLVFPDTRPEDWLDCDQCRDCFKPAFTLRPGETAQYSVAISNFEERDADGGPLRFRWGFISSSDDHHSRPGTGYKQFARKGMTDARGVRSEFLDRMTRSHIMGELKDPQRAQPAEREPRTFRGLLDVERGASFMYPGGLVAVHAEGRNREAIWAALKRREVYGTSGPRILLWFDLLNGPDGRVPMGSRVVLEEPPRFEVRAVGSFMQKPGCPRESIEGLSPERLESLCLGECYHPSDERHSIVAIEIIRIRPQHTPGENVDALIEDPWRSVECEPDPTGCVLQFEDEDYPAAGRDVVYYARVLQAETPAINAANQRTEFDAQGNAVRTSPCFGNYRTDFEDDCLAPIQERAWSSPIYVDQARPSSLDSLQGTKDAGG